MRFRLDIRLTFKWLLPKSNQNTRQFRVQVLIAGAAGFLGSHLVDRLLAEDHQVVGVDDLSSGTMRNLLAASDHPHFQFFESDVAQGLSEIPADLRFDLIVNLASLASPRLYQAQPLHTLKTGSLGTLALLELAARNDSRFVMASTSEVYGDPEVHPQNEAYFGNVNPVGERSCYDEAKRFSEALCYTFREWGEQNVGVARIFNTYGPRLSPDDGRVVSNLLRCAVTGEPFSIYGDGLQTRSLCFVSDLIDGLCQLASSHEFGPVNLGNPSEITILDLVHEVEEVTGKSIIVHHTPALSDDPKRRRPDISRARELLGWHPHVSLRLGLTTTYQWMRAELEN